MTDTGPKLETVCVFCGSGKGENPAFAKAAHALGKALASTNTRLVYGGGDLGLMGVVARSALDHGGHVIGIMPDFLHTRERMLADVHELVIVDTMHERKHMMFERADAFVALPGGIGTLEEFVEQLTWSQLGQHRKPIVLVNIHGFWDPLLELFERMTGHNFIRSGFELKMSVAETADDILPVLRDALEQLGAAPVPDSHVTDKL